jgi:tryptophan synthase alpha chain
MCDRIWYFHTGAGKKMADISDGAIVGSAIVKLIEKYGTDAPEHVAEYVKSMKDAIRS